MRLYGMKMKVINGALYFYDDTKIVAIIKKERALKHGKADKRKAV